MGNRRKPGKQGDPAQITATREPAVDEAFTIARIAVSPTVRAAMTVKRYANSYRNLDLAALVDLLTEQTRAGSDSDLKMGEAMLRAQAHTLDAIFNRLAQRAVNAHSWSISIAP